MTTRHSLALSLLVLKPTRFINLPHTHCSQDCLHELRHGPLFLRFVAVLFVILRGIHGTLNISYRRIDIRQTALPRTHVLDSAAAAAGLGRAACLAALARI